MTVQELIDELSVLPRDLDIRLSDDDELNGHHGCYGASVFIISNHGELYDITWTANDACMEEDEWEQFKQTQTKVVVI